MEDQLDSGRDETTAAISPRTLFVIIVHGTWATSKKWKDPDSNFRRWLTAKLVPESYEKIEYDAVEWDGKNGWESRIRATRQLTEMLMAHGSNAATDAEFMVVGHSHGGNIATEAVRDFLSKHQNFPLIGVVCLNTPFLKLELRATSYFLVAWCFLCLLVGAATSIGSEYFPSILLDALALAQPLFWFQLSPSKVTLALFFFTAVLAFAVLLNRNLLLKYNKDDDVWSPRPPVLCLSCADDEAITLLGLGEGIANFPQLLFHPVALGIAVATTGLLIALHAQTQICPADPMCWATGMLAVGVGLIKWIGFAMIGGLIGTIGIYFLFGLDKRLAIQSMVSRVLVTYTPLKPADTSFRAIVDVNTKWSPAQIIHSRIYESKVAVDELCAWLHARRTFGHKMRTPSSRGSVGVS